MSGSNFLSAKSLRFRGPFDLPQSWLPPGRTENDGRQQRRRLFPSRRKLLSCGFPEIVRDSSTSLGMTKTAENEPATVSLPRSVLPFVMSSEVETSLTILRELLARDRSTVGSSLRSTPLSSSATIS